MMSVDELMSMVRQKEIKDFGNHSSGFVSQGDQIQTQQNTEQDATSIESTEGPEATVECGGPGQPPCPSENGIDLVDKQFLAANLLETFGLISGIKAIASGVTKLNLYLSGKILAYRASKAAAKGGIAPKGWITQASKKGGGTIFKDPSNPHNIIRQMPGNPNSPNVLQQNPYVKFMKDGKFYDVNGKVLPNGNVPDAHIPLNQFNINNMPKF